MDIDNSIFFADFGTPAVIAQPGQPDKPVTVIFDPLSMSEMGVLTDKPQITIKDSDLAGLDLKYDTITVPGKFPEARILKPLPDGTGLSSAILART